MKVTKNKLNWTALPVAAALAIALPLAQAGEDKKDKKDRRDSASYDQSGAQHDKQSDYRKAVRGSTLEGMNLRGEDREELASVDDVIVELPGGEIEAVVATTGFLGIGGTQKKLDIADVNPESLADREIRTTVSSEEFRDMSAFEDSQFERERQEADGQAQQDDRAAQSKVQAMSLRDRRVQAEDGSHLGEVDDWIVDINNGVAPYLIVRVLPGDPTATRYDYYAVSSDQVLGLTENGDVRTNLESGDLIGAERIGEDAALEGRGTEGTIYVFAYEPSDSVSASQRMED